MVDKSKAADSEASKPKLVVFSPYPPVKNGIADYVAELMPYHLADFDVTLVIADDAPVPTLSGPRILFGSEFRKHRAHFEDAPKLYHIGNNGDHAYMLDFLKRDPGVVVLHDGNLCYLHETATLMLGNRERHLAAMEYEYGALGRDLVRWQLDNGYRELFTGYELRLTGDVLEQATAVITHSRQSQYRAAARVPHKSVWRVPHHLSPRASAYYTLDKPSARAQLGLPVDEILVTAVGFVTRAKQIALLLDALSGLREQVPRFRFVLAGERRPHEYDVDSDIARSAVSDRVICTDYLDEDHFFRHLVAADIVVNLRYPSVGEMSGTLVRALGLGVPTIVLDHGPMGEFPDGVVRKVEWSDRRQDNLSDALFELMSDAAARREYGSHAAHYIRREHDIAKVSKMYARILHESLSDRPQPPKKLVQHFPHARHIAGKLRGLDQAGREAAQTSDGRIWWTVASAPLGSDPDQRALVVSARPEATATLLSCLYGWQPSAVTSLRPEDILEPSGAHLALPLGHFAFALVVVPADITEHSAALLMTRINALVARGGGICVETWAMDEKDTSEAPLGRERLAERLQDAGFASVREWTAQDGYIPELVGVSVQAPETQRHACASARKMSDYSVWRFDDMLAGLPQRWGGRVDVGFAR